MNNKHYKYQEALDYLKRYIPKCYGSNEYEQKIKLYDEQSINTLQELLNKETSKKPICHNKGEEYEYHFCPKCGEEIINDDLYPNYCECCGQALKWEEDE